ncbi:type II toxin-antitoxin system HipA family toxin [Actinomadura rubteroloni]|nr:type II toxin-antitoxin system HipA family toxin [Actinomadura rubteroloni]
MHGVWLGSRRVGAIHQRGDHTRFVLDDDYRRDPERPVLGLIFEQDLLRPHAAALRLPPWFSNLLPEGLLKEWIADDRGVSIDREMELLIQVGHDLPGAVRVVTEDSNKIRDLWETNALETSLWPPGATEEHPGWRFSLAGVQLKFSMISDRDRLTLPAFGEGGDWIVKLPDREYSDVPLNEYAMMSLARSVGIDVPDLKLVHRDAIAGLPDRVWPRGEEWAYAVRRFDRDGSRARIHIEDLAQVCNLYPDRKYSGNYESIAALVYRRHDIAALAEFARRLTFIVLIGNGDAHLKNWSLIYRNPRMPTLSPAYDLVSTAHYRSGGVPENLGLRFGGSKLFDRINVRTFERLERKLSAERANLAEQVADTVRRVLDEWPRYEHLLKSNGALRKSIGDSIDCRAKTLLR